jgi:hypothetical protein
MDTFYRRIGYGRNLHKKRKDGLPMNKLLKNKSFKHWTKQFFDCKKIAEEPALNREGFWKKKEHKEFKIERADTKEK